MGINRRNVLMGGLALSAAAAVGPASAKPYFGDYGVDSAGFDGAVDPGDDFYRHVNGGWLKGASIPPDRSRWGEFDRLRELSDLNTKAILEQAALPGSSGVSRKIGDFYASFMDEAAIEARGTEPLKPELARIAAISTPADLALAIGRMNRDASASLPVNLGVGVDQKSPERYITSLSQGGLGLPDRDYYMVDQPAFVAARESYRKHVAKMLGLAGFSDADARAERIFAFEDRLARTHWSRVESRDADKTYNPWPTADLAARAPGFAWGEFLTALEVQSRPTFIVRQPTSLTAFAALAQATPLETWRDYLAFRLIASNASVLPKAFAEESFDFNGRVLNGTPEQPIRWKRGVAATNGALGDAVGRLYAAKHFPPDAKAKAEVLIANVMAAMARRIKAVPWMTAPTKAKALEKLAALRVEIGYEETPRDYSNLEIVPGDAYGNRLRALRHDYARAMAKLTRPVDRGEWSMTAATVNAQANFVLVKIMFPAAILQPPFFDPNADPAVNYGGIGVVIGHEISHQFDDQGSKYDATGRLSNWWSPQDLEQFRTAAQKLVDQYDAYEPLPGTRVQGALTLGENIGDLAGIAIAYDAYKASREGRRARKIKGVTPDQRFFQGYGQIWRNVSREPALRQQLTTDPHSPGEQRVLTVRNVDAWYRAFNVGPDKKLYLDPKDRVRVW